MCSASSAVSSSMRRLLILSVLLFLAGCEAPPPDTVTFSPIGVDEGMGGQPDPGFERAIDVREFRFPQDHGPHPRFATEWWYFTGNLRDDDGRRFGYQFTLFRVGLTPGDPAPDSDWRAHQISMGHLALSDIDMARHMSEERFSRAAAGLAGAKAAPFRVWLGPWSTSGTNGTTFPITVDAETERFGIRLQLERGSKPPVLQGERGLSRKSAEPGNASYYYSHTRLPTRGRVRIGDKRYTVEGNSWFDREWSSSALAADQAGWDWFALQLEDGRDLMFYQMRDKQGRAQHFSKGVLVGMDGKAQALTLDQVTLTPRREWTSPDGTGYPLEWQLRVPEHGLDLNVSAAFDEQEMRHTVRYWEGAVEISGSHRGVGYLELSGYAD